MANRTVSELCIYPIKSCRGIGVPQAFLDPRGFRFDRRWMIADKSGMSMTQREYPRMSLVLVEQTTDELILNAPGMQTLRIPLILRGKPVFLAEIWGDTVRAMQAEKSSEDWISSFLGVSCRFVYMPDESFRPVNPRYAIQNEQVSFVDAFPILLISEASLADLNSRLQSPLPMNRFRPNIVVAGCAPYEEDSWKKIQIGSTIIHVVKPCVRCATTIVDQSTGIRGKEPLRTLATYRNRDGEVSFGQNLIHESTGELHIGDAVTILAS